jgi:hypothetical protein
MATRRETCSDHDSFVVRLKGRSTTDRQRLMAEHRAYLAGEREEDADFGEETAGTGPTGAATAGTGPTGAATATGTAGAATVRKPSGVPLRRPTCKAASYIAAAKKRMKDRLEEERAAIASAAKTSWAKGKRVDKPTIEGVKKAPGKQKKVTKKSRWLPRQGKRSSPRRQGLLSAPKLPPASAPWLRQVSDVDWQTRNSEVLLLAKRQLPRSSAKRPTPYRVLYGQRRPGRGKHRRERLLQSRRRQALMLPTTSRKPMVRACLRRQR